MSAVAGVSAVAWLCIGENPQTAIAAENAGAVQADRAWLNAVRANQKEMTSSLLDRNFLWIEATGRTRSKTDTLENLRAIAAETERETGIREYKYDRLEVITGVHHNARFMRLWVDRSDGWRAFVFIDTKIGNGTVPFSTPATSAGDCENPCRSIPFTPTTKADKEIVGLLERLKMDEWRPNPADWSPYVLDGVDYVTSAGAISKADRVAHLEQEKKLGAPILPGDPVISMRMADFGKSVVMVSKIAPYSGGKPYYSLRSWTYLDGRWQLANSQQTTIEDAAPLAPRSLIP